uniref:phage tail spike protein n=2 Tax=Muricomes intestini TaxID=1796634 RepID=UPI002FDF78B2
MLISIHDKTLRRVAYLDNEKPKTMHYFDDTWHRYLTEATSTFDFSVPKTGNTDIEFLTEKGYVSFSYEGKSYLFSIMRIEETEKKLTCYCENLNLELLNETSAEYKAPGARTFVQYLNSLGIQYAQLELGINEVSDLSRTLEWTGQDTKLARLLSLVNKFDAECEFVTYLNRDGTLDKIVMNIYRKHDESYQGVGTKREDVTLYYGKEIKEIRRTIDKTGLYTAIKPIGTDGLTIRDLDKTELDEEGNVLFRSPKGETHIYCPQTKDEYPSQIVDPTGDKYINLDWTYETKNVNTLYGQALAKLKSIYMPAITYEVDGFIKLEIGDTIKMHDAGFTPLLLLEARVSEQEISFSKPDRNKTIFSNFRALQNKLSGDIQSRLEALIQEAVPYKADIITTDGLIFKNSQGSTTLTARVSRGTSIVTNQLSTQWYKDGATLSNDESITVNATDVNEKAVYRFEALDAAGEAKCFAEVTIADVSDGDDGPPGVAGADGRGITGTEITYQASANGTTVPTGIWTSSIPAVPAGQYLWTRVIYTYSDSTTSTAYSVSKMGETGAQGNPTGVTVSATEPTEKHTGMLWQ